MFSTYFLYVIEIHIKKIIVYINFKAKNCIWKLSDLVKLQKTKQIGHFSPFLDVISGPHVKILNEYSNGLVVRKKYARLRKSWVILIFVQKSLILAIFRVLIAQYTFLVQNWFEKPQMLYL